MSSSIIDKPPINNATPTNKIMLLVIGALIPGFIAEIMFLGWGVLINLVLCGTFALLTEAAILKLRKRSVLKTLSDNSALLTGLLIAAALPPILPWWMSFIGVSFAIIFAKQLYGGLGFNPFNPAMVGYVLLLISFPVEMTAWLPSVQLAELQPTLLQSIQLTFIGVTTDNLSLNDFRLLADGFTMATPLDQSKTAFTLGLMTSEIIENKNYFPNLHGWIWINFSFLIGGSFLLFKRIIHWQIPVSMLLSLFVFSLLLTVIDSENYLPAWVHLMSGATMLGVFFIATDPVSASTTPKGRLIYGAMIGFFIIMIRTFGGYPDAIAFSVLLLNIAVPTIDHYTKPKVYGSKKQSFNSSNQHE